MAKSLITAINKIEKFREEMNVLLKEESNFSVRINSVLLSLENGLRHATNTPSKEQEVGSSAFSTKPMTSLFGVQFKKQEQSASQQLTLEEVDVFKKDVEKLYEDIMQMDEEKVKKLYEPLLIRAVAKKAGISVTATEPEITHDFIKEIKLNINDIKNKQKAINK